MGLLAPTLTVKLAPRWRSDSKRSIKWLTATCANACPPSIAPWTRVDLIGLLGVYNTRPIHFAQSLQPAGEQWTIACTKLELPSLSGERLWLVGKERPARTGRLKAEPRLVCEVWQLPQPLAMWDARYYRFIGWHSVNASDIGLSSVAPVTDRYTCLPTNGCKGRVL